MNPERVAQTARAEAAAGEAGSVAEDLRSYFQNLMSTLRAPVVPSDTHADSAAVATRVVDLLFSRPYSYLGRSRARVYEDAIREVIVRAAEHRAPVPLYLDIGGGYHASIDPARRDVSFDVGLGELFVLSQFTRLRHAVARFYSPGMRFCLVIDNLCALLVNDIPLAKTLEYCARLRRLVDTLRLADVVSVLIESEHHSGADVAQAALVESPADVGAMTSRRHGNVERFLGRPCTEAEAMEREARYHAIVNASERLLDRVINGIHMTQRATETTMCFRPFPGGDSRIQSGQVVMTRNANAVLHPILLTSANANRYVCSAYRFPDLLPREVEEVAFAAPAAAAEPLGIRAHG